MARIHKNIWYLLVLMLSFISKSFILIAGHSKYLQETKQDWQIFCTCALSQFEGICNKILSGEVTMDELNIIRQREKQMIKLCTVVTDTARFKKGHSTSLKKLMNARLNEFEYFTGFKYQLHHFTTYFKTISVEGK